jgi:hypothetical protein
MKDPQVIAAEIIAKALKECFISEKGENIADHLSDFASAQRIWHLGISGGMSGREEEGLMFTQVLERVAEALEGLQREPK